MQAGHCWRWRNRQDFNTPTQERDSSMHEYRFFDFPEMRKNNFIERPYAATTKHATGCQGCSRLPCRHVRGCIGGAKARCFLAALQVPGDPSPCIYGQAPMRQACCLAASCSRLPACRYGTALAQPCHVRSIACAAFAIPALCGLPSSCCPL